MEIEPTEEVLGEGDADLFVFSHIPQYPMVPRMSNGLFQLERNFVVRGRGSRGGRGGVFA